MQATRFERLAVLGILGLSLTSAAPLHGQTAGGEVDSTEAAVCAVKYIGYMLDNPFTAGVRYGMCIDQAAES